MKKIENIITFQIKIGHYLEILIPETKKLLGSTKNKIAKAKIDKNVPHLELAKVILVCCNIVNNNYQQDSRVSYTFVSNKPFGQLLEISPTDFIFLKIFNLVFQVIEVWFRDQNNQSLEIEGRINLTLVIK